MLSLFFFFFCLFCFFVLLQSHNPSLMLLRLPSNLYHRLPTTGPCYCHAHVVGWQRRHCSASCEQSIACACTEAAWVENARGLSTLVQVPARASNQLQEQTPLLQLAELFSPLQFPEHTKLCQQNALCQHSWLLSWAAASVATATL